MGRNDDYYWDDGEEELYRDPYELERELKREQRRRKEMRRRKKFRRWLIRRIIFFTVLAAGVTAAGIGIHRLISGSREKQIEMEQAALLAAQQEAVQAATVAAIEEEEETAEGPIVYTEDESTVHLSSVHRKDASEEAESSDDAATTPEATSSEADTQTEPTGSDYSFDQNFIDSSKAAGFTGEGTNYISSEYAILINQDTGKIMMERDAYTKMYPASMTKVLTVLVAAEHLESEASLRENVTITQDIVDQCWLDGSSTMYYVDGDKPTVEELFYGTILPSGADAAYALAKYTAGSEEAFVQMMNDKVEELGLSATTHFTNPVGTYADDHYSTAYDMAVIMAAAMQNDFCAKVLSAHTYEAAPSIEYPNAGDHIISNWFLRRIEDKDSHGTVIGAKTGFVNESGCCAVSTQISNDGGHYLICTADTWGSWRAIFDHVAIYSQFTN